jgi:hypothetical protein
VEIRFRNGVWLGSCLFNFGKCFKFEFLASRNFVVKVLDSFEKLSESLYDFEGFSASLMLKFRLNL